MEYDIYKILGSDFFNKIGKELNIEERGFINDAAQLAIIEVINKAPALITQQGLDLNTMKKLIKRHFIINPPANKKRTH